MATSTAEETGYLKEPTAGHRRDERTQKPDHCGDRGAGSLSLSA